MKKYISVGLDSFIVEKLRSEPDRNALIEKLLKDYFSASKPPTT